MEQAFESWNFAELHKAVLGVLHVDLHTMLQKHEYREQINLRDSFERTPLHWAAARGDARAVKELLDAGADTNAVDHNGIAPLSFAAFSGCVEALEILILGGATVHAKDNRGTQAIHFATRHQAKVDPVKVLLRAGARLTAQNKVGHTPFTSAAISNRFDIGAYLLREGSEASVPSVDGNPPLFQAIFNSSHEFLWMLLEEGVDYDQVNKVGSTILHVAALEGDIATVQILQAANLTGLDLDAKDGNGRTAFEVFKTRTSVVEGFQEVFEGLIVSLRDPE
jgi:ankyrin repeat protein